VNKIGLHSGWNKRKSGLGGVRVTYLKINFGLEPNAPRVERNSKISVRADLYLPQLLTVFISDLAGQSTSRKY
jgi:hypothetical protein